MEDKSLKKFVQETIETTVKQIVCASHGCRLKEGKNIYKQTEARLYAYPTLLANIERYKLDIEDLKKEKVTEKSKDITRWSGNSGVRLTPEEKQLGKIMSVQIKLERDQKEVDEISAALEFIAADYYKLAVVWAGEISAHGSRLSRMERRIFRRLFSSATRGNSAGVMAFPRLG